MDFCLLWQDGWVRNSKKNVRADGTQMEKANHDKLSIQVGYFFFSFFELWIFMRVNEASDGIFDLV